jgi:hypothetical protein
MEMYEDEIPVGRAKDLRGQKFGRLTVLYRTHNVGTNTMWKCECECGSILSINGASLNRGATKSCGCLQREIASITASKKKIDLKNKVFGRLTVIDAAPSKNGDAVWKCKCECGNIINVLAYNLTSGHTKSCGCLCKEKASERMKNQTYGEKKALDLTNQKFGLLTALYPIKEKGEQIKWMCKCDCGNETIVRTDHLRRKETFSCGCSSISIGEFQVQQILKNNNIFFTQQQTFNNCRFENGYLARFDFFIENKYLIEYDGEQHFKCGTGLFNNIDTFTQTQIRDDYKNQWCKDNNIPLIRIPYTKLGTLCIEDLLLETTQFRVV